MANLILEQCALAKEASFPYGGEDEQLSVLLLSQRLALAFDHHVKGVALLTLLKNELAVLEGSVDHRVAQRLELPIAHHREDADVAQRREQPGPAYGRCGLDSIEQC